MKKLLTAVLTVTLLFGSNLFAQNENVNVADFGFWETPADSSTSFDAKSGMLSLGAWKGGGIWFGKDVSNCDTLTFTYKNNKAPANLTLNYINDEKAEREIPAGSGSLVINLDKAKINKDGQYIGIQAKGEDTSMQIVSIVFASEKAESKVTAASNVPAASAGEFEIELGRVSGGQFKDKIIFLNKSFENAISVKSYYKENGEWKFLADVNLTYFDEELVLKGKQIPAKAKNITAIKIESFDGRYHEAVAFVSNQDLHVEIREQGTDLKKAVFPYFSNPKAYLFDRRYISGEFDENMKIRNQTNNKGLSFNVSVYDVKKQQWVKFGTATTKKKGDESTVKSKLDLEDYKYFAIESMDNEDYNYMPVEDDSDLIINVAY